MLGVRISWYDENGAPKCGLPESAAHNRFETLFRPVFGTMGKLHWVFGANPFTPTQVDGGPPPDIDGLMDAAHGHLYAAPGVVLPVYARHLTEDWNDLYGLPESADPVAFARDLDAATRHDTRLATRIRRQMPWSAPSEGSAEDELLERAVEMCLFNVDNALWQFFARSRPRVDTIREHAADLGFVVTLLELRNRL